MATDYSATAEDSMALVIDNDRTMLHAVLELTRACKTKGATARGLRDMFTGYARACLDDIDVDADHDLVRVLAFHALTRIHWVKLADHYLLKVSEGVTA